MQAVRRVGVQPVTSNIVAFRNFMKSDSRNLGGFPAQPYTESEVSDELTKMLARSVRDSGRFWSLSLEVTIDLLRRESGTGTMSEAQSRLENRYDLDGWLAADVQFEPDHTRVRLLLKSSQNSSAVLAREDITLKSSPTSLELDAAVHSALAKIQNTLGHDGRITWTRNELAVVDFGKERGMVNGSRLAAGHVLLSSLHPASREFFRSKKLKLMDLVVVEARSGSSLCRIVSRDRVAADELKALAPGIAQSNSLLVWRSEPSQNTASSESDPPQTLSVGTGFGQGEPKAEPRQEVKRMSGPSAAESHPISTPNSTREPVEVAAASDTRGSGVYDEPDPSTSMFSEDEDSENPGDKRRWDDPATWEVGEVNVGGGIALASLKGSSASASTGFPMSIINALRADALLHIGRDLSLAPEASLQFFGSGDATGYRLDVELPLLVRTMGEENVETSGGTLELGGGLEVTAGQVEAEVTSGDTTVNLNQEFLTLDAVILAEYRGIIPGVGTVGVGAGLSITELATDDGPGLGVRLKVRPNKLAPKELSLYSRLRFGPGIWSSYEFGGQWLVW
jgi:hypothetical protein